MVENKMELMYQPLFEREKRNHRKHINDKKKKKKKIKSKKWDEGYIPAETVVEIHVSKPGRDGLSSKVAVCNFPRNDEGEFLPILSENGNCNLIQHPNKEDSNHPDYRTLPLDDAVKPYNYRRDSTSDTTFEGTGRLDLISPGIESECPPTYTLEGLPEDDNGTFIPICFFSHRGIALEVDVCTTRECVYHGRLYIKDSNGEDKD